MTDEEGARLAGHVGREASWRAAPGASLFATGCNVIATKGGRWGKRVVVFAHIDTPIRSPGASDNASGDDRAAPAGRVVGGLRRWFGHRAGGDERRGLLLESGRTAVAGAQCGPVRDILLGINIDDVGYRNGRVAYSMYDCPAEIASVVHRVVAPRQGLVEGEPSYQGDHGLYLINRIPTLALTSEALAELMGGITHTPRDTPEIIDPARLVGVAQALADLLLHLNELDERAVEERS